MDQSDVGFALSLEQEGERPEQLVGNRDQPGGCSIHAFTFPEDHRPQRACTEWLVLMGSHHPNPTDCLRFEDIGLPWGHTEAPAPSLPCVHSTHIHPHNSVKGTSSSWLKRPETDSSPPAWLAGYRNSQQQQTAKKNCKQPGIVALVLGTCSLTTPPAVSEASKNK